MATLIGRNTRVEVEKTLASGKSITAISKANPGVITFATSAHGIANGDIFVLESITGMVELEGQIAKATGVSGVSVSIKGIDTTGFGTFTSGGGSVAKEITAWSTLGKARSLNAGTVAPNKLDSTVLIDSDKSFVLGQNETPEVAVEALSDVFASGMIKIESSSRSGTALGFRATMSDNSTRVFRGYVSLPSENIPLADLVTQGFSIVQIKRRMAYA
ncbi:MAG TPA: phage tail tube protein [Burkholderiales bacterium]|nr:phage tail tube protein [Burkholderiales bacterium]